MTVILLLAIKHLGKTHTGESHHSNLDDYGFRKLSHMINIPFLFLPKIGKELKGKVYIKEVYRLHLTSPHSSCQLSWKRQSMWSPTTSITRIPPQLSPNGINMETVNSRLSLYPITVRLISVKKAENLVWIFLLIDFCCVFNVLWEW